MFLQEKRNQKSLSEISKEQNNISSGTKIKGDIEAKGDFRIDGTVEGTVKTTGKVVLGKEAFVNGRIECENADIEGKFIGKLHIRGTLNLRSTAVIEGEAKVAKLAIEPGATFNASCAMKGGIKNISNEKNGEGRKKEKEKSA